MCGDLQQKDIQDLLMITQDELYEQAKEEGRRNYLRGSTYLQEIGKESESDYGKRLVSKSIIEVEKHVWEGMLGTTRMVWHKFINDMDPNVVTTVALRSVFDSISENRKLAKTCTMVASAIEREAIAHHVYTTNRKVWHHCVNAWTDERGNRTRHQAWISYIKSQIESGKIPQWTFWDRSEKIHLGVFLIECIRKGTGFIRHTMMYEGIKRVRYITPTPELFDWIRRYKDWRSYLQPAKYPMVEPPLPWVEMAEGGYPPAFLKDTFIKSNRRDVLAKFKDIDLPARAVNALQSTKWRINRPVLDVVQTMWKNNILVGELCRKDDYEIPPYPENIKTLPKKKQQDIWRTRGVLYRLNMRIRSQRLRIYKTISMAETLRDNDTIWFPYNCDFRGRVYALPSFLSPQGGELSRSLLEFSDAKKVSTKDTEAMKWMKNHGANCYGIKGSYKERIEWVDDHSKRILRQANEPMAEKWWREADDPFMFLAFCFGWKQILTEGTSNLPCSVDASNNGLQILSLLSRDKVTAHKTNAAPNDYPQDIYDEVAKATIDHISKDDSRFREGWLRAGIDRKTCKNQVMIRPYGGTNFACVRLTDDWFRKRLDDGMPNPFTEEYWPATQYLGHSIWKSMNGIMDGPKAVMTWIRKVAVRMLEEGKEVSWVSPSGFPVHQSYEKTKHERVETKLDNQRVRISYHEPTGEENQRAHINATPPNFIHSLDAACLHFTVNECIDKGVDAFSMIHDSYGTYCTEVGTILEAGKNAYYKVFNADQLRILAEGVDVEPPPEYGDLDPKEVLESEYLFS